MGKFRTRVKGKGKKWKKGHSSSSNPNTKTHRDAARSRFFQENLTGKSNLTTDALQKHDVLLGSRETSMEEGTDETGTFSTFKTFQTFASDWSECSNMSFNGLLKRFNSRSALHKEMLAILAAVTEVIKANGGKETSTEYFASLMTTLEASENEDCTAAVLSLLAMGIKTVPQSVLRIKFSEVSKTFLDLLSQYAASSNNVILRHLIGCLSVLLRAQDAIVWTNSSTIKVFDSILSFSIHSKPKVRKAAQHAVCAVLKGSAIMLEEKPPTVHPAAIHAAKFCIHHMETGGSLGGSTTMLHILVLLKEILATFPKTHLKQACECILKVMTLGNVLILSCGMQALHGLFISRPSASCLSAELNAQLITALYDYQPAATDLQPTLAWLAVMQEAFINLAKLDLNLWIANLPRLFSVATNMWLSDRKEIMSSSTLAMEMVLESSMKEACSSEKMNLYHPMIHKVIQNVESGLKYQFYAAWPYVLHLLGVIFEIAGGTYYNLLQPSLKSLGELRDTEQFSYKNELEKAVGQAIRSMGPEKVLATIPLQITGSETNYEFRRSWILPVLKENIRGASLKFFIDFFLPLASMCRKKAQTAENQVALHSYSLLQSQIWSLLPSFCGDVPDLQENFKGIAKILGVIITEHKDIRIPVMTALRRLIVHNRDNCNEDNIKELKKFAKNYLPILFNVYTSKPVGSDEEGQRLAAFETIKVYLSIANPELCEELFEKACAKMDHGDVDEFTKESILDLLRNLIPYQSTVQLNALYSRIEKGIVDAKNREQKKCYRLLEEMCGSSAESCRMFVKEHSSSLEELLLNSLSTCVASTKGPRLRCLIYLVQRMENCEMKTLQKIIPEAMLCCKDINGKCRLAAFNLLVLIGETMQRLSGKDIKESVEEYITLIMAGLSGPSTLVSATLLALGKIAYEFRDIIPDDLHKLLLENVCLLVVSTAREIVASALSYVRAYIVFRSVVSIGPSVPTIVKGLLAMTEDCKRHFRQKCRDILDRLVRKFGYNLVAQLVPNDDVIMHKRLRNLRKINDKKRKKNKESSQKEDSDDEDPFILKSQPKTIEEILEESDSDFEDTAPEESQLSNKKKHRTWIHEDADSIVDFTDVSAAKKIVASLPSSTSNPVDKRQQKKKETTPFKMSSDGRLMITNDESEDEDRPKRNYLRNFQEDSDDDDEMIDASSRAESMQAPMNRKRKLTIGSETSESASKYKAGGSGIHRPTAKAKFRKHTQESFVGTTGEEYRAKKTKGDVKRKGLPDPYAYVPLSRKMLNRRKKMKRAGDFNNLVQARKGVQKGSQKKMKNKMRK